MKIRNAANPVPLIVVASLVLVGLNPGLAQAATPPCGTVITSDTTLSGDMDCAGTAIVIGADGVTLDLGGYTVSSQEGVGFGVDNTGGYDEVTVKNGTIGGFEHCIITDGGDEFTAKDLTVYPGWENGIHALNGHDVTVKGLLIPGMDPSTAGVVFNAVTDATVKDCQITGGFGAIAFGGGTDETGALASSGSVKDCIISDSFLGVLLGHATDVKIANNEIINVVQGVRIGSGGPGLPVSGNRVTGNDFDGCFFALIAVNPAPAPLPITDLKIDGNYVHDSGEQGITLVNVSDSVVTDNSVVDNGLFGIRIWFSTDNRFQHNAVSGHAAFDIWATPDSTPNIWTGNTCDSSWGPDIDCP